MALGFLEKKLEEKLNARIGALEPKLDEMNKHLANIELLLKSIDKKMKG